jgi:hypothetical protein
MTGKPEIRTKIYWVAKGKHICTVKKIRTKNCQGTLQWATEDKPSPDSCQFSVRSHENIVETKKHKKSLKVWWQLSLFYFISSLSVHTFIVT